MTYDTGPMRAKLAKATPGVWRFGRGKSGLSVAVLANEERQLAGTSWHHCSPHFPTESQAIEDFLAIVALHNDAPALLDTIDAQAAEIVRLRRILHRYGDRVPMAMCHRPDWQQSIDDAMQWVADNPEASRDQIAADRSEPFGRESTIRPGFFEDDMP